MNRKEQALRRIGLFHIHVADKAGFCLICSHPSRPERQQELLDFDFEYDDSDGAYEYENNLLRWWGYTFYTRQQFLASKD
ncbi:hypothetical protein LCGC14_1423160 [marine sediment metagenome]|uniref:Uncharacterized protein n=1 Tax=marine sediment metagenome TaxID=412755 RepID=A0A0F9M665_9ZZZZ